MVWTPPSSYERERNLNHYGDAKMAVAAWKCGWRHRLQNKHPLAVREKIRTAWRRGFLQKPWNPLAPEPVVFPFSKSPRLAGPRASNFCTPEAADSPHLHVSRTTRL